MISNTMRMKTLGALIIVALMVVACGSKRTERSKDAFQHYRKGVLNFEAKRYSESIEHLERAVRMQPDNVDFRMQLALVHFALGEWDEAEASLREAIRLDPYRSEAHRRLGMALFEKGERAAAIEEFRAVLSDASYPKPETVWVNIGQAYEAMGNSEEAVTSYRRALDSKPDYPRAHYELAKLLDKLNRLEEAIAEYDVAAPHYEALPEFHYRLGLACFRAGKKDRAREHFQTVVQKAPGSTDAARAEEYLQLIR
jgi:tetratricopeptide (TPR) repeat protein